MQYDIPQFIEEESKIVGPLTIRQFFIFIGAAVFAFILFFIFELWLWVMLTFLIFSATAFLSFGKIQGRPAYIIFFHFLRYQWNPKLYIWKSREIKAEELFKKEPGEIKPLAPKKEPELPSPLSPEKIKELAKQLDQS